MNAVGTSITAIRSQAAQIIVVHLIALVIKATLEAALSASLSITQVWSDIELQHYVLMVNSKLICSNRAIVSASITLFYCGAVLMFSMAIIQ